MFTRSFAVKRGSDRPLRVILASSCAPVPGTLVPSSGGAGWGVLPFAGGRGQGVQVIQDEQDIQRRAPSVVVDIASPSPSCTIRNASDAEITPEPIRSIGGFFSWNSTSVVKCPGPDRGLGRVQLSRNPIKGFAVMLGQGLHVTFAA